MESEPETKVLLRGNADVAASPPEEASGSLHALQRIGRYEVVQRLGHGGMATVYLGRATGSAGFERVVAVKVIHQHLAAEPEFVEMFLDEAKIAARIHSPHVAGILDLGEDAGFYFMVVEYIDGETLSGLLRQLRPAEERLPLVVVLQILADACEGLIAVHGLCDPDGRPYGLVHRDMSPQNLIVNFDGWTKIVDFGLVKATGLRNSNHTGHLRGKLAYMAPEQVCGLPVSAGTDLFALGVILWEMLTGRRLFASDSDAETIDSVKGCAVPPLREFRPDLVGADSTAAAPTGVEALLRRALARDPEDRYQSAEDMLADIRALLRESGDTSEPRRALGAIMRHHFGEQAKYRWAAIRGASRGDNRPLGRVLQASSAPLAAAAAIEPAMSDQQTQTRMLADAGRQSHVSEDMSSPTDRLAAVRRRPWGLWLTLPLVGAGLAAVVLLFVLPRGAEPRLEAPITATPASHPSTVVWNFETDPAGAVVTIQQASPEVFAVLAPQLEGHVTPLRLVVPYDDQARLLVTLTRAGYRPSKLSLIPMNNENFNLHLPPEPPPPPPVVAPAVAPVTTNFATATPKKKPRTPTSTVEPVTPPETRVDGDPELKDEPEFDLAPTPVKGGR